MPGIDSLTWQALGLVLTLIGLGLSALVWRRKGAAHGLRTVTWSLLPLAAGLTGTLRLVADLADAVGRWATRFVFSPTVWLGLVVAVVAAALFAVSARLLRARPPKKAAGASLDSGVGRPAAAGLTGGGDLDEIEAILRKHGIS